MHLTQEYDIVNMNKDELWYEYNLSYYDQLLYLKQKYGMPEGNYYLTEECKSTNNKIKRGKEGLFIHHDYEWNPDDISCHSLSDKELALSHPYEYQTSPHLTYCNLLEHLILHIKIYTLRKDALNGMLFIDGVERFLVPQINDIYQTKRYKKEWLIATKDCIQENKDDYLHLLELYSQIASVDISELLELSNR